MKISQAFPTKWLAHQDLDGKEFTLTIARVTMEDVGDDGGQQKPVVWFHATQKGLVLNKTNAEALSIVYGDDTDQWLNQKCTLFTVHTEYRGKPTMGIRVRAEPAPLPAQPQPGSALAPPTPPSENPGHGLDDDSIPF